MTLYIYIEDVNSETITRTDLDGNNVVYIPKTPGNRDYQQYLEDIQMQRGE